MRRREARCPLCGATLTATAVLDACEEIVDADLHLLGCRCPHCQGYFEVRPAAGVLEIGYLGRGGFDVVIALPCEGLRALHDGRGPLAVEASGRSWRFAP